MNLPILSFDNFKSSTITIKASLSSEINVHTLANFLVINNRFDENNNRIKKSSKSRAKIDYTGPEESIVSICYDELRRGMRTGAMNNMLQMDVQYGGINVHNKLSSNAITIVGVPTIELAKRVFQVIINKIINLKQVLDYCNEIDKADKIIMINYIVDIINEYMKENDGKFPRYKNLSKNLDIPASMDHKFIKICLGYLDDYDRLLPSDAADTKEEGYKEKLDMFIEKYNIMKTDSLDCKKYDIFNSVYHIESPNKNYKISIHQLAFFLHRQGVNVEYHNWTSDGVNICFDIEDGKEGINHAEKDYKHRFIVQDNCKIRQCSPTFKEEAYVNYKGLVGLINEFFNQKDVNYTKYILRGDVKCNNIKNDLIDIIKKK